MEELNSLIASIAVQKRSLHERDRIDRIRPIFGTSVPSKTRIEAGS